jgi:hypothetical protein
VSTLLSRERLAAVLALLGSPHDGEALAAARTAERLRARAGATWADLLAPLPAAKPERAAWRATVAQCRAHPELLTPWETRFLAGLAAYRRGPSERQAVILARIAARVVR